MYSSFLVALLDKVMRDQCKNLVPLPTILIHTQSFGQPKNLAPHKSDETGLHSRQHDL